MAEITPYPPRTKPRMVSDMNMVMESTLTLDCLHPLIKALLGRRWHGTNMEVDRIKLSM